MTRTTRRHSARARLIPVVLSLTLLAAACGGEQGQGTQPAPATATSAPASPQGSPPSSTKESTSMLIRIVINDSEIRGSLDDTATAREFAALLPLTLTLADFHGTERVADLPRHLTTTEAPPGTEPRAGDITYYAPWGNLALFYRDFSYSDGLIHLGRLDTGAANMLAALAPDTPARIELATGGAPTGR